MNIVKKGLTDISRRDRITKIVLVRYIRESKDSRQWMMK